MMCQSKLRKRPRERVKKGKKINGTRSLEVSKRFLECSWWFALNLEGNVVVPAKVFGMMSMFSVRRELARCVGTRGTTDPAKNHKMMRV